MTARKRNITAFAGRDGEIVIRKEKDVIAVIGDYKFWKAISRSALEKSWSKEDDVWDKLYSETK